MRVIYLSFDRKASGNTADVKSRLVDSASYTPQSPPEETATARVRAAYARIDQVDRPEVWITLRPQDEVLTEAKALDERLAEGERLPLAGLLLAVKDNVDVAGLPTTAGCPSYAYWPERSATAVARLVEAGALVLGKTNLDQFATGLVGTRSPYGAVRAAHDPRRVAGGSSSGSAVAVALGIADIGIATDTAGSGRVPAAFNGLVGLKATRGLVPTTGVVPACRSYDCVSVLAATLTRAQQAIAVMAGPDVADPLSRTWPADVRLSAGDAPRVAAPAPAALAALTEAARTAFSDAVDTLRGGGARIVEFDASVLFGAARLLYDGALVAERYAAVGRFVEANPHDVDPVVAAIIKRARALPAHALVADLERLDAYRARAAELFRRADALLMPTAPAQPTFADVAEDPIGVNAGLGTYTNFANLLDLAAVAVPGGMADGTPFGVTVFAPAFADQVAIDVAARLTGEQEHEPFPGIGVDLVVFGAHLRGEPLNPQLGALGARFCSAVETTPEYRMVLIPGGDGTPPKPGIVRVGPKDGAALPGERWRMSPSALGTFLAALPAPMNLGAIALACGDAVVGFGCDLATAEGAEDITAYGGWRAYLHR
jgi:allophanate hydrolase